MNAALHGLVDWLSLGLLHGTALALLTALAAATLLRRARPALHAALWAVVLAKFLVPVGPGASFSLSSALERFLGAAGAPEPASVGAVDLAPAAAAAPAAPDLALLLLAAAYLAGLAVVALRRTARRRALLSAVARLPLAPPEVANRMVHAAVRLGLSRAPEVRIDAGAAGPYLVGRLRPVLVLPAWLDPATPAWAAAVAHELAHIRRRDPWLGAVEALATLVFWFWPPVLWARARLDRAREMACDQWALAHGPLSPRAYAHLLVEVAVRRARGGSPEPVAALGLLRRRGQLAARVDHLLDGVRPARLGRLAAVAAAAWALLSLAGASRAAAAPAPAERLCSIEPELIAQIMASSPDADADRDGVLTQDEACAHQLRLKQRLQDDDTEQMSQLDPADELFLDAELCTTDRCKEQP